jgi:predicted DNA-binding transcriptional regulator YafY
LLETLRQASRECRRVRLAYQGLNQADPTTRVVDPYALLYRWGRWYAAGYCHRRKDMRIFRLDRIRELSLLPEHFEPWEDFDSRAFFEQEMEPQTGLTVRLQFLPEMAAAARANTFHWEAVEEQPDGSMVVTMKAPDLSWAASTALAYGPGVTVVEPEEVRQEVRRWAEAIAENYRD